MGETRTGSEKLSLEHGGGGEHLPDGDGRKSKGRTIS